MSTDMLEDFSDKSQSNLIINRREKCYKIRDHIERGQVECKGELLSTQKMGKGLQKAFRAVVNEISQALPILGESVSEVFYFIPETRNFAEVIRLSEEIKKLWLKETTKDINNLINHDNF